MTHPERTTTDKHGTTNWYRVHKCRCDVCVAANREYQQRWRDKNRTKINERNNHRYQENPEPWKRAAQRYKENNPERYREVKRKASDKYWAAHPDEKREKNKRWAQNNKQRRKELDRNYRERNRDKLKEQRRSKKEQTSQMNRKYRDRNAEKIRARAKRYLSEHYEELRPAMQANYRARQDQTSAVAHRKGLYWTGPEVELVDRDDMTLSEMAVMLGRTYAAVVEMRSKLRRGDPKALGLVGRWETDK